MKTIITKGKKLYAKVCAVVDIICALLIFPIDVILEIILVHVMQCDRPVEEYLSYKLAKRTEAWCEWYWSLETEGA